MLIPLLTITLIILAFFSLISFFNFVKLKKEINYIELTIEELLNGNLNRRLITKPQNRTSDICLAINDISRKYQKEISDLKISEKNYKVLMINLSHDVRTPLASMLGYLELLIQDSKSLNKETLSALLIINKKSSELKEFIDLLFQWTKLDANEDVFNLVNTNLTELLREILGKWIDKLEDENLSYTFEIPNHPLFCTIDIVAFERIINNLLKNIINYSKASHLLVSLTSDNTCIRIKVRDNGIGISNIEQPYIFDRLYRCDHSRGSKGNGLGLAIVKELVNKLNGEITLESTLNSFTQFIITFTK